MKRFAWDKNKMVEAQHGNYVLYSDVAHLILNAATEAKHEAGQPQQLKAENAALANEIERRTRDQVSISPLMAVERLRQLSAV